MKKIALILSLLIVVVITILTTFVNSNYFFDRYIAKNITEYGFSYTHAQGALLDGFVVEDLKYKNRTLSSNVELKINPLRLLNGVVSVSKINLIGVHEDVLESVLNDFKPSSDSNESNTIALDFELKNILLTIKPFQIKEISVKKNSLSVDYVSYLNNRFNVGDVNYEAKTNLGDINFEGKFEHRVLHIYKLAIEEFALKRVVSLIKGIKSEGTQEEYHMKSNPFIPQQVFVDKATLKVIPFIFENIKSKELELSLNKISFDVSKLLFVKGSAAFEYSGNLLSLKTDLNYKNKILTLNKADLLVSDPQKIEEVVGTFAKLGNSENNSSANVKIFPIEKIKVVDGALKVKACKYGTEEIKGIDVAVENFLFDLEKNKIVTLEKFNTDLNSSLGSFAMQGSIGVESTFDSIVVSTRNADKLLGMVRKYRDNNSSSSQDSNSTTNSSILPKKLTIRRVKATVDKLTFAPFNIKHGSVFANDIKVDLSNKVIKDGNLSVNADSNWGKAFLDGNLRDNNYFAKGSCSPNQLLLDRYSIPLKAKNFKKVKVEGRFGFEDLDVNGTIKGENILTLLDKVSISDSQNRIKYNYQENILDWIISAKVLTPYLKQTNIYNRLIYKDDATIFSGSIKSDNVTFLAKKYSKLFKNIDAKYSGDEDNFNLEFISSKLKGEMSLRNYEKGVVSIESRTPLLLSEYEKLPKNYKDLLISTLMIDSNINLSKTLPLKGNLKAVSNLATLDNRWVYDGDVFKTNGKLSIPSKSILFKKHPLLRSQNIKQFNNSLAVKKSEVALNLEDRLINAKLKYDIDADKVNDSSIKLGSLILNAKGNLDSIALEAKTNSILKSQDVLSKLYRFNPNKNIDGQLSLKAILKKQSDFSFTLSSPKIEYKNKNSKTKIEDLKVSGLLSNNILNIDNYKLKAQGYSVFGNKSSQLNIGDVKRVAIKPLWINDSLQVNGTYNLLANSGKLQFSSSRFKLENSDVQLDLGIDTSATINREKIYTSGVVTVLDGKVKKAVSQKNVAENENIIILQRKKSRESTKFAKNIKLDIKIKSKNGIIYSRGGSKIQILPDLQISKEYNRLSNFNGIATIGKGSYYYLNDKKLIVEKGEVIFKGKSMTPNLNIVLRYYGREYKVRINIVGTPNRPMLYFSSDPALNKDQILAYLLFDDSSAAGTHNQAAMVNTIAGSIAKSFLGSMGIKIDHINIKEQGFSIGKNLGKHVIIYYNQENETPSIKTRVDISKSIHTEVEVGQQKQSADIIFSKEY